MPPAAGLQGELSGKHNHGLPPTPYPPSLCHVQGEVLLKYSADELAPIREGEPNRFAAIIRERKWQEFVLRIKAQAQ